MQSKSYKTRIQWFISRKLNEVPILGFNYSKHDLSFFLSSLFNKIISNSDYNDIQVAKDRRHLIIFRISRNIFLDIINCIIPGICLSGWVKSHWGKGSKLFFLMKS